MHRAQRLQIAGYIFIVVGDADQHLARLFQPVGFGNLSKFLRVRAIARRRVQFMTHRSQPKIVASHSYSMRKKLQLQLMLGSSNEIVRSGARHAVRSLPNSSSFDRLRMRKLGMRKLGMHPSTSSGSGVLAGGFAPVIRGASLRTRMRRPIIGSAHAWPWARDRPGMLRPKQTTYPQEL